MEIQKRHVWNLAILVVAALLILGYWFFIHGYPVEETAITRFAEQEMTGRFGLKSPRVRSIERINGDRTAAFIFQVVDASGIEYHLAAAFRQSLVNTRYQPQDMFLIENDKVGAHASVLTVQDYLRSYRFDVRSLHLQLQSAPSRFSAKTLTIAVLAILFFAGFLFVFNRGDQAGIREAAAAESDDASAAESDDASAAETDEEASFLT